jgi:hypothetical protein
LGEFLINLEGNDMSEEKFKVYAKTEYIHHITIPIAEYEAMKIDAERWRGFIGCARIRFFGWAGYNGDQENYRHFGGEFWTQMGKGYEMNNEEREQSTKIITGFADASCAAIKEGN